MFHSRRSFGFLAGLATSALVFACSAGALFAQTDDSPDPGNSGRVRYMEGAFTIDRPAAEKGEEGTINAPVFAGDILRTDGDGLTEVQLADGSLIRLAEQTEVEFRSLIDPYGRLDETTILRLFAGALYLDVRGGSDKNGALVQIDTPAASVYVQSPGLYRVDVKNDGGRVEATAHRGSAEVVGEGGSVFLRSGQRTWIDAGASPIRPTSFNSFAMDGFDRWNEERTTYYARLSDRDEAGYGAYGDDDVDYEEIPDEVEPYVGELSRYGRWVLVPEYGRVWYPIGVGTTWRPYSDGRWVYGPYGWYWVSYDPWGWAPYHYGRWSFTTSFGWVWVPGHVFGGAWVSWYYGPSYIGWCPLDFYNRPAFVNISFNIGGYGYDPYAWCFVPHDKFVYKNVHKVIVRNVPRTDLDRGVIVRRPVPARPDVIVRGDPGSRTRLLDDARTIAVGERNAERRDPGVRGAPAGDRDRRSVSTRGERSFRDEERGELDRIRRGDTRRALPRGEVTTDGVAGRADSRDKNRANPQAPSRGDVIRSGDGSRVRPLPKEHPRSEDRKPDPASQYSRSGSSRSPVAPPDTGSARESAGKDRVPSSRTPRTYTRESAGGTGRQSFVDSPADSGSRVGGSAAAPDDSPGARIRKLFRDAVRPRTAVQGSDDRADAAPSSGSRGNPRSTAAKTGSADRSAPPPPKVSTKDGSSSSAGSSAGAKSSAGSSTRSSASSKSQSGSKSSSDSGGSSKSKSSGSSKSKSDGSKGGKKGKK